MSTLVTKSHVMEDGLRYRAKASGSPFGETNQYAHTATISCFLCDKQKPRAQPMKRKFLTKARKVCAPKCEK